MQYELYENKIKKVASFLALILKYIVLVVTVLALIVGSIVALLVLKGRIISVEAPTSVTYGNSISCSGKAFLSDISFEYLGDNGEWSETPPVMVGQYKVRAKADGSFGTVKYSDELAFAVTPATLSVFVSESSIEYGAIPSVRGNTVLRDTVLCDSFTYGKYEAASGSAAKQAKISATTTVTPDLSSVRVLNENGQDVTRAYNITTESTELGILPRAIKVTVEDKEKTYDGVSLTWDGYELSEGTLAYTDSLMAVFSASITDVGQTVNTPELLITNASGDKMNLCYSINIEEGMLSVDSRQLVVQSKSDSWVYDGKTHSRNDYSIVDGSLLEGHTLSVNSFSEVKNVNEEPTQNILKFSITSDGGTSVYHNYSLMLQAGELTVLPRELVVEFSDDTFEYDALAHTYGKEYEFDVEKQTITEKEFLRRGNSEFKVTDVGVYNTENASVYIKNTQGEDISANFEIKVKRQGTITVTQKPITVGSVDYSAVYSDGRDYPDWASTVYLASGELCSGQKLSVSIANSDDKINVGYYVNDADIKIVSGSNDVTGNYQIDCTDWGSFEIYRRDVTVSLAGASKIYDDTPLKATRYSISGLVSGHSLKATIIGSITDVNESGTVYSDLDRESIVIRNSANNNVTDNYNMTVNKGWLEIIPRPITISTASGEHMYDAEAFTLNELDTSAVSRYLVNGHSVSCTFSSDASVSEIPEGADAGYAANSLIEGKTKIIRDSDKKEVQDNYEITYSYGTLKLTKRTVTVTSASNSWEYDGIEHYDDGYDVTSSIKLVGGAHAHRISKVTYDTFVDAGTYDNNFSEITIVNNRGKNVTHNYDITLQKGTLTIRKREIIVTTGSASKIFDGMPLWTDEASADRLLAGHTVQPFNPTSITYVKESIAENRCSAVHILDADYNDLTANYTVIEYKYGELEIQPCKVVITTGSVTRLYDPQYPISSDKGEIDVDLRMRVVLSGNTVHKTVGKVSNKCDTSKTKIVSEDTGEDLTDNFIISGYIWGVLNAIDEEDGGVVYIKVALYPVTKTYTGSTFKMSPNEFSPEILSQGKYSINYGDLAILMTDTGYFTLGELNNLAADANIRVTSLDGSGAGKTYKVIFVTPMGSQNEDYKIFTVKKKSITVTATSAELVYKAGAILSCNDASITKGSLVDGHTYSYYCDGFIDCSKPLRDGYVVTNAISNYQIFDKEGNDVSFNYDIKYEQGLLTLVKQ